MHSFTESHLSDSYNIAPFKILLRLIQSTCSAFVYFDLFILINGSGIFKRYNVVSVR